MLTAAAKRLPGAAFVQGDAGEFDSTGFDLVFANAVFHWVPAISTRAIGSPRALPQGGVLALQMPDNEDEPSHRLMRAVAARAGVRGGGAGGGDGARTDRRLRRLRRRALPRPATRSTSGARPMRIGSARADDIVKWVEGAGLRPLSRCARRIGARGIPRRLSRRRWRTPTRRWPTARCCSRFRGCLSVASRGLTTR